MESTVGDTIRRKTVKISKHDEFDQVVFYWFAQQQSHGIPLSGSIIQQKALDFNEKKNHVYNCDETGLNWKALPQRTLASSSEKTAPGYKARNERITVMICVNASGEHSIPILVIEKAKKPRAFKNMDFANRRNKTYDEKTKQELRAMKRVHKLRASAFTELLQDKNKEKLILSLTAKRTFPYLRFQTKLLIMPSDLSSQFYSGQRNYEKANKMAFPDIQVNNLGKYESLFLHNKNPVDIIPFTVTESNNIAEASDEPLEANEICEPTEEDPDLKI
ncbi:hypothetical protein NQ314_006129 [Rhamnusium bicolor]|uniref:Transposase n=1 Tax=Rhamnusium bicolor TaxID=1586634 RepID=A0AAV8Z906_9CUCU|nr:hypothetical protein NQ314_006129 [Rhamnusium bicolor]